MSVPAISHPLFSVVFESRLTETLSIYFPEVLMKLVKSYFDFKKIKEVEEIFGFSELTSVFKHAMALSGCPKLLLHSPLVSFDDLPVADTSENGDKILPPWGKITAPIMSGHLVKEGIGPVLYFLTTEKSSKQRQRQISHQIYDGSTRNYPLWKTTEVINYYLTALYSQTVGKEKKYYVMQRKKSEQSGLGMEGCFLLRPEPVSFERFESFFNSCFRWFSAESQAGDFPLREIDLLAPLPYGQLFVPPSQSDLLGIQPT